MIAYFLSAFFFFFLDFPLRLSSVIRNMKNTLFSTKLGRKQLVPWPNFRSFYHDIMAPVTSVPALGTGCMFSRAGHRLHVFSSWAPVACFPALDTGCTFCFDFCLVHVFWFFFFNLWHMEPKKRWSWRKWKLNKCSHAVSSRFKPTCTR